MTGFDLEKFMNETYYSMNFGAMISDVLDFLEFSESNIEWQHRTERQSINRRADIEKFGDDYREHLLANADHRFAVSLPMRLRYASLVALVTTVEWEAKGLKSCAESSGTFRIGRRPRNTNEAVHILTCFDEKMSFGGRPRIEDFRRLVVVRNAIVHSGGIERDYKHPEDLNAAVQELRGFSISPWHFLGECVKIERGALQPYIQKMAEMLPAICERAHSLGLLGRSS